MAAVLGTAIRYVDSRRALASEMESRALIQTRGIVDRQAELTVKMKLAHAQLEAAVELYTTLGDVAAPRPQQQQIAALPLADEGYPDGAPGERVITAGEPDAHSRRTRRMSEQEIAEARLELIAGGDR